MNAYIYPNSKWKGIENPYLENFVSSFKGEIDFVNFKNISRTGLLDIFRYIFRINLIFFNWIEDVPSKKGGMLQWYIFKNVIYPVLRFRKVKIIWVLHNNVSHYETHKEIKQEIFNSFFKYSDLILTHAEDGIQIINQKLGAENLKAVYYPHPFNNRKRYINKEKDIDILIWGSVSRYKGIHIFLDQVQQNEYLQNLNIKICGKVMEKSYEALLYEKLPENVHFENRFVSDDELDEYLSRSKITLFIYASDSVLSSGALSDSVGYGNVIIGPSKGAFKDLSKQHFVLLFQNAEEIPQLCKSVINNYSEAELKSMPQNKFLRDHTWNDFSKFFIKLISN